MYCTEYLFLPPNLGTFLVSGYLFLYNIVAPVGGFVADRLLGTRTAVMVEGRLQFTSDTTGGFGGALQATIGRS